uniref:Uncharacterized protein n=1 Tax=Anguilla anguilla TaxID=7936 RepID=A0A0E9QNK3_ANGAN
MRRDMLSSLVGDWRSVTSHFLPPRTLAACPTCRSPSPLLE